MKYKSLCCYTHLVAHLCVVVRQPFLTSLFLHHSLRFPIWTVSEYKTYYRRVFVLSLFSLPMLVYFVIQSLRSVRKTKAYLRIVYASTALFLAIFILALSSNPDQYFCKDNAIAYNMMHDGKCRLSLGMSYINCAELDLTLFDRNANNVIMLMQV